MQAAAEGRFFLDVSNIESKNQASGVRCRAFAFCMAHFSWLGIA